LHYYIKNEKVLGSVNLITTKKGDKLLITQKQNDVYFVGELYKDTKGYYAIKDSQTLDDVPSLSGFVQDTKNGKPYTILYD
jgi:hypothetical protein